MSEDVSGPEAGYGERKEDLPPNGGEHGIEMRGHEQSLASNGGNTATNRNARAGSSPPPHASHHNGGGSGSNSPPRPGSGGRNMVIQQVMSQDSSRRFEPQSHPSSAELSAASSLTANERPPWKDKLADFLESGSVAIVMSLFTFYALFGDDIRMLAVNKSSDGVFTVLSSIAFFLFAVEILISAISKDGYILWPDISREARNDFRWWKLSTWQRIFRFGSFYFWLDLVATLSLVFEISWMVETGKNERVQNNNLQSARAGRASRAGARAGRVIRIVRMVRLVRLVKLYKYANAGLHGKNTDAHPGDGDATPGPDDGLERGESSEESLDELPPESHVGAAMSDLTTRRVIILVLAMLIVIPLLTYTEENFALDYGIRAVHEMVGRELDGKPGDWDRSINIAVSELRNQSKRYNVELIEIKAKGTIYCCDDAQKKLDDLRPVEQLVIKVEEFDNKTSPRYFRTVAKFDFTKGMRSIALNGLLLTIVVLIVLVIGTFFFTKDVSRLVIGPIERMVELVQQISANPLGFKYTEVDEKEGFTEGMETTLLLQSINKIGGLMRVGFGEAGADVIAQNLSESTDNKLNLLTDGMMIQSIFGFCDVRNFTDTTECLQEEVMLFVNRIAHIVHTIVVQCSGAANKNVGDAFLLTWKLDERYGAQHIESLADKALYSFVKVIIETSRHNAFVCKFSPAATSRLYDRMPRYKVRMGFGLHVGWAVEGAIGSQKKIDASYLSPHVNMSEFLESSTKEYGVGLLMSEPFFKLLSQETKTQCRMVDYIRKAPDDDAERLYTYDMDPTIDFAPRVMRGLNRARLSRVKSALMRQKSKRNLMQGTSASELDRQPEEDKPPAINITPFEPSLWLTDRDIAKTRGRVSQDFLDLWRDGIANYVSGKWELAAAKFQQVIEMQEAVDERRRQERGQRHPEEVDQRIADAPADGPAHRLLEVMKEHDNQCPAGWNGRILY